MSSKPLVSSRPSAPKDPSDRMHRVRFPAQLGEHPGRNERRDEEHEPDANHGEHAITAQTARNRVFPSKKSSFLVKQLADSTNRWPTVGSSPCQSRPHGNEIADGGR